MSKRDDYLKFVTLEHARFGHLKNAYQGDEPRVSLQAYESAAFKGNQIRDKIYRKHKVWDAVDANHKIRNELKRSLSCGDTLDEPENVELIKELKRTKIASDLAGDNAQKECEALKDVEL